MRTIARKAIERLIGLYGYRLTDQRADPAGLGPTCERLKARGFQPRTVIDVGVGPGTPWLYQAFATSRFALFEPQTAFRPQIEAATQGLDATVHYCALGDQPACQTIQVNADHPTSSSMAGYRSDYITASTGHSTFANVVDLEVPVRRLDDFGPFDGPTLLKLDVEGYEAQVLRGGRATLAKVDIIISEVSVAPRTESEPSLAAYLCMLEGMGFSAINIAEIVPMGRDGPIAYMDMVFARSDSPLRYG